MNTIFSGTIFLFSSHIKQVKKSFYVHHIVSFEFFTKIYYLFVKFLLA